MFRKYTKMEVFSKEVFHRKAAGETNRDELVELRMKVELLQNFLSEAGGK